MSADRWTVFWVDDEPHWIQTFIDVIGEDDRFVVELRSSFEDAMALVQAGHPVPDLLIWDMIMPRGRGFSAEQTARARKGLRTGVVFFEEFRKRHPDVPMVLLTNVTSSEVLDRYSCPEERSWAWQKDDFIDGEDLLERLI